MFPATPRSRLLAAALLVLMGALPFLLPEVGMAQAPGDVAGGWTAQTGVPSLPEVPEDYITANQGDVRWQFPRQASEEARALMGKQDAIWLRLAGELGTIPKTHLTIRLVRNPDEMRALAPRGHGPPTYAVGVAYPRFGVVLLSLTAPDTWERPNMETLLTHELSHIALYRATGGRPLPRWFIEGVAVQQAGEYGLERNRTLLMAALGGSLLPLESIERGFPQRPHSVNLAYAQSASFVAYLHNEPARFRLLFKRLREGMSFEDALSDTYHVSMGYLEREWRADLEERYRSIPILLGGSTVWVLAVVLLVIAYARQRRRHHQTLRRWEAQEAKDAAAEAAFFAAERDAEGPSKELVELLGHVTRDRESSPLPTIEHEGKRHTLH
ncbi:MAG: hypothetical protein KC416_01050 [Myxococcales bacterium]|nr:hypothetical protein [Myxococcales bacterium]